MTIKIRSKATRDLENLTGQALTIGELIRSIRLSDEYTQVEFAALLGLSKSHLCDIEKGRKALSVNAASTFADKLQFSKEQFIRLALQGQLNQAGLDMKVLIRAA